VGETIELYKQKITIRNKKVPKENFFENIYKDVQDLSSIPWATLKPNIYLTQYLDEQEEVQNKRALVIGCGLGDDALILSQKGYQTDAIDISPSAISLAKERFKDSDINFQVENIFNLSKNYLAKYDFVYEGLTIQSIPRVEREKLIKIISSLIAPKGTLLIYAHRQEDEEDLGGPPWPLYRHEFEWFIEHGFTQIYQHESDEKKPIAPFQCCFIYQRNT